MERVRQFFSAILAGMLMWQGAAAFNLFTGKDMPTKEVYELFFK